MVRGKLYGGEISDPARIQRARGRVTSVTEGSSYWSSGSGGGPGPSIELRPYDSSTVGFLGLLLVLTLVFGSSLPDWGLHLLHQLLLLALASLLLVLPKFLPGRGSQFLRDIYPLLLFTFIYEEVGALIHLFIPGTFDQAVQAVQARVFGGQPTLWFQAVTMPVLTELMQFFYFSYYLIIASAGLLLYFGHRQAFGPFLTALCLAYYGSYVLFILVPVEGPRFAMADQFSVPLEGGPITRLQMRIMAAAAHQGGAMPSSHVAAALVGAWAAARVRPRLAIPYLACLAGLAVATVYGRYHYVLDVLAGILVGLVAWWFGTRWWAGWEEVRREA